MTHHGTSKPTLTEVGCLPCHDVPDELETLIIVEENQTRCKVAKKSLSAILQTKELTYSILMLW